MAAIGISGIEKNYGPIPVLRGIDLDIADGEFVVLVGPSGCGKSTLLRLIAGLEAIDRGELRIAGRRVNELAPKDRDLAMVFQSYALYPHMTVADNMSYALRLRRTPKDKVAAALAAASAKLGLERLTERKPRALSGGQRQRVAMGRAIVRHPQAFLFDEPLSNLDARLREQMRFEIRKLHRDLGATSVYVTHDQIEAMTMADRIVAMNEGVIQQVGTPAELYDTPANLFVAGFIGSPAMNVLQGEVVAGEGGTTVRIGGAVLASVSPGTRPGPVTLGVRPERIALTAPGDGATATVELVEPTGLATIVHLDLGGQPVKTFTTERLSLKAGEPVGLRLEAGGLSLFAPETGERLVAAKA
ncbi:sn-glycerol-3-phosphate ABC transporter ATP-binding protein UgpC [Lichenihabitans sp. Uapishka_5]|uniref:ABC transporter ATP-binding protein n=1 Tax=Lichenihabitans sp. Uapishka_5 TaxID=3037302 RepID=UPI0029E7D0D4|nr:sn-glycerol-3-phosphate ABC transporter ATP-binding protein UgpC [Lichenihabitans sp. Uapishka_5]MDX7952037.1 sn-glycerol-3-phosphate ABC transporter ATP-binding protein UgpC [Lichenihabitans sp. Uapishka_5]